MAVVIYLFYFNMIGVPAAISFSYRHRLHLSDNFLLDVPQNVCKINGFKFTMQIFEPLFLRLMLIFSLYQMLSTGLTI